MSQIKFSDLVLEKCNNPRTGDFILDGPPEGAWVAFAHAFNNGDKIYYCANDSNKAEWGIGILTIDSPSSIKRVKVIKNTEGNSSLINFTGGVKIYSYPPSVKMPVLDNENSLTVPGSVYASNNQKLLPEEEAESRFLHKSGDTMTGDLHLSGFYTGDEGKTCSSRYLITTIEGRGTSFFLAAAEWTGTTVLGVLGLHYWNERKDWHFFQNGRVQDPDGHFLARDVDVQNSANNLLNNVNNTFVHNSGDTMTGWLRVNGENHNNYVIWGNGFQSVLNANTAGQGNNAYTFSFWMEKQLNTRGGTAYGVIEMAPEQNSGKRWLFNENGAITTPQQNSLLEIQGYDRPRKIQCFQANVGGINARVNFPVPFNETPLVILGTATLAPDNKFREATIVTAYNWDSNGFTAATTGPTQGMGTGPIWPRPCVCSFIAIGYC